MIGAAYSQSGSLEELEFYAVVSPANVDIDTFDFSVTVDFDVEAYNFSSEGNLSYDWSSSAASGVTILSPTSKQTQIRFSGFQGATISGTITCKVSDSGLPSEFDALSQYRVSFK